MWQDPKAMPTRAAAHLTSSSVHASLEYDALPSPALKPPEGGRGRTARQKGSAGAGAGAGACVAPPPRRPPTTASACHPGPRLACRRLPVPPPPPKPLVRRRQRQPGRLAAATAATASCWVMLRVRRRVGATAGRSVASDEGLPGGAGAGADRGPQRLVMPPVWHRRHALQ